MDNAEHDPAEGDAPAGLPRKYFPDSELELTRWLQEQGGVTHGPLPGEDVVEDEGCTPETCIFREKE